MTPREHGNADYPLGPALDFLKRIWQLNHALEKVSSRMERRFGITAQQRLVIRCIGKYPGILPGQLARLLHVDPGTVSAALKRLESKNMVVRRRDPRDRRRTSLGLTEKGHALERATAGTVEGAVERLLDAPPVEEIRMVTTALERLTAYLEEE